MWRAAALALVLRLALVAGSDDDDDGSCEMGTKGCGKRVSAVMLGPFVVVWMFWNLFPSGMNACHVWPVWRYVVGKYTGFEALIPKTRSSYRRVVANGARDDSAAFLFFGVVCAVPTAYLMVLGLRGPWAQCAYAVGGAAGAVLGIPYALLCYGVPHFLWAKYRPGPAGIGTRNAPLLEALDGVTCPVSAGVLFFFSRRLLAEAARAQVGGNASIVFAGDAAPLFDAGGRRWPLARAYWYTMRRRGERFAHRTVRGIGSVSCEGVFRGEVHFDGFSAPDGANRWIYEIYFESGFHRVVDGRVRSEPSGNTTALSYDLDLRPTVARKDAEAGSSTTPKPPMDAPTASSMA